MPTARFSPGMKILRAKAQRNTCLKPSLCASAPLREIPILGFRVLALAILLQVGGLGLSWAEGRAPLEIPIEILEPPERQIPLRQFPVQTGIAFLEGELASQNQARLIAGEDRAIPFESRIMQRWPDGSIRWLLVHFRADAGVSYRVLVEPGAEGGEPSSEAKQADAPLGRVENSLIEVDTGALRVRIPQESAAWDLQIFSDGKQRIRAGGGPLLGTTEGPARIEKFTAELEENGPLKAIIRVHGEQVIGEGKPAAGVDIRLVCHKGESFIRVHHTMIWKIRSPEVGIRGLAFLWNIPIQQNETYEVGLLGKEGLTGAARQNKPTQIAQATPFEYVVVGEGSRRQTFQGRLSGAAALEGKDGKGVAVSLRDLWQMYPAGFTLAPGILQVDFWPAAVPPGAFTLQDLLPKSIYLSSDWKKYPWSKAVGHAVGEYQGNPYWEYTPEGVARTHEFTLLISQKGAARTAAELHDLTQNPPAVRQDPAWAMRQPVLGFHIPAFGSVGEEDIERAVDVLGKASVSRRESDGDYGFWRFGMQRWDIPPSAGGSLYRWMDGVQYDQQLIPSLLFMRGGDRSYFNEAHRTARFGMDVATNHYTTRNAIPGYQAGAACFPFPWAPLHLHKHTKIHFLENYYHLTGDLRARDVLNTVMDGALQALDRETRSHARELYAGNLLWPAIWEETHSDKAARAAQEWSDLTHKREFDPDKGIFNTPITHAVTGAVYQDIVFGRPELSAALLKYLKTIGLPDISRGGIEEPHATIACPWAFEKTGDVTYLARHASAARNIADSIPVNRPDAVNIRGNELLRNFLFPMLTGLESIRLLGSAPSLPTNRVLLTSAQKAEDKFSFVLRVKPGKPLEIHCLVRSAKVSPPPELHLQEPFRFQIKDSGKVLETVVLDKDTAATPENPLLFSKSVAVIPSGSQLTVEVAGAGAWTWAGVDTQAPQALKLSDQPLAVMGMGGQDGPATEVFLKTMPGPLVIHNFNAVPYTIRDAETGERLYQSTLPVPMEESHAFGEGRLLGMRFGSQKAYFTFSGGVAPEMAIDKTWFRPSSQ